jgi:hypothetical protein
MFGKDRTFFCFSLILCGEEKSGKVIVYSRAALFPPSPVREKIVPYKQVSSIHSKF